MRHGTLQRGEYTPDTTNTGIFALSKADETATDYFWLEEVVYDGYRGTNHYKVKFNSVKTQNKTLFETKRKIAAKRFILKQVTGSFNTTDLQNMNVYVEDNNTYKLYSEADTESQTRSIYCIVPLLET